MCEMKPCPFCGQREVAVIKRHDAEHPFTLYSLVQCASCLAEGPLALDADEAVEMWNRRASKADEIAAALRTTGTTAEKLTERIITAIMRGENADEVENMLAFVDKLVEENER